MSLRGVLHAIDDGLQAVAKLAPLASTLGGPVGTAAATIVTSLSSIIDNIRQRVDEGELVATSTDKVQIEALARKVQDLNEQLDQYIQNS